MFKHILRVLLAIPVLAVIATAGILVFTAPKSPPLIAAVEVANDPLSGYVRELPPYSHYAARDGSQLAYHLYPGKPGAGVVVAVHGSSGTSLAMHGVAKALSARGMTVYAIDLRGHGMSANGRLGDVGYIGQFEDDLDDLAQIIKREHPGEKRLLIGHSMGGAIILRTAASPRARNFDGYLALAPFIAPNTPMDRKDEGGWTVVSIPRIIVLSVLNGFGIHALDHLNVLAMAVAEDESNTQRPRFYSHALLASSNLQRDWQPAIAAIRQPTRLLIGAEDELFHAEAYPPAFKAVNPAIQVTVLPGLGHMAMVYDPRALTAEVDAAEAMLK